MLKMTVLYEGVVILVGWSQTFDILLYLNENGTGTKLTERK